MTIICDLTFDEDHPIWMLPRNPTSNVENCVHNEPSESVPSSIITDARDDSCAGTIVTLTMSEETVSVTLTDETRSSDSSIHQSDIDFVDDDDQSSDCLSDVTYEPSAASDDEPDDDVESEEELAVYDHGCVGMKRKEFFADDDVDEESYFFRHTPPPRTKLRNVAVQCDLQAHDEIECNLLEEFSVSDPFDML